MGRLPSRSRGRAEGRAIIGPGPGVVHGSQAERGSAPHDGLPLELEAGGRRAGGPGEVGEPLGAAEEAWGRAESTDPGLSCRRQAGGAPNPAASLRRSSRGAPMTRWRARVGWGSPRGSTAGWVSPGVLRCWPQQHQTNFCPGSPAVMGFLRAGQLEGLRPPAECLSATPRPTQMSWWSCTGG